MYVHYILSWLVTNIVEGLRKPMRKETLENALEILRKYDTVILVDDSGSMNLPGSKKGVTRWFEVSDLLLSRIQSLIPCAGWPGFGGAGRDGAAVRHRWDRHTFFE
jgi:hypothetical protein